MSRLHRFIALWGTQGTAQCFCRKLKLEHFLKKSIVSKDTYRNAHKYNTKQAKWQELCHVPWQKCWQAKRCLTCARGVTYLFILLYAIKWNYGCCSYEMFNRNAELSNVLIGHKHPSSVNISNRCDKGIYVILMISLLSINHFISDFTSSKYHNNCDTMKHMKDLERHEVYQSDILLLPISWPHVTTIYFHWWEIRYLLSGDRRLKIHGQVALQYDLITG